MNPPTRTHDIDDINKFYHIHDKKLGEGGFAKVRLATHLATRQYVAIKCLDKIKLGAELPRIYNEIECLKKLKHHNIARLYQVFETPSMIFLVLEYCAGGELFDYIVSKSKLEESESAQIIYDLMRVLDFIHVNGFAHRDLKPENLLFDERHQIKLIDFGLAANCSPLNMANNSKQAPLDALSTCCGSVTYAAPEVISGGVYSGTSVDVWSAGVMLYALLVGQLPFNDTSISKLYQKIQAGIKSMPSFLSPEASDLIRKMLTVDPKQRITVREVLIHPWLRNRVNQCARIHRRLEFSHSMDEQLLARCCEKFPHLSKSKLTEYIQGDLNYYSTTYYLMQSKSVPRSTGIKRTPDRLPMAAAAHARPYVSPTKRSRFVTVTNSPRAPKTPPAYLQQLQESTNTSPKTSVKVAKTPTKLETPTLRLPTDNQHENYTTRMAPFMCGPTPKKSIVKRLLESATPSKLRQPRKILMCQNEFMNITLTHYREPHLCLSHFQEALVRRGFECKRKDFSLKCFNGGIRLTLEVCMYNNQCAIQRKRIKGDAWQYKLVCEEILRISNTSSALGGGGAGEHQDERQNKPLEDSGQRQRNENALAIAIAETNNIINNNNHVPTGFLIDVTEPIATGASLRAEESLI